jgi:hypothetical protein
MQMVLLTAANFSNRRANDADGRPDFYLRPDHELPWESKNAESRLELKKAFTIPRFKAFYSRGCQDESTDSLKSPAMESRALHLTRESEDSELSGSLLITSEIKCGPLKVRTNNQGEQRPIATRQRLTMNRKSTSSFYQEPSGGAKQKGS